MTDVPRETNWLNRTILMRTAVPVDVQAKVVWSGPNGVVLEPDWTTASFDLNTGDNEYFETSRKVAENYSGESFGERRVFWHGSAHLDALRVLDD